MKNLTSLFATFILMGFGYFLTAQTTSTIEQRTSISTTGDAPDSSAILDVQSTQHGMLVPRMTSAERTAIASPADGLLVFDTDEASFWYFSNGKWLSLITGVQPEEFGENTSTIAIPDNNPGGISSIITLAQDGVVHNNSQIEVCLRIGHSIHNHLDISLEAPDGTAIDLSSDNGSLGGATWACFTTAATVSVTTATIRLNGTYIPEEPFSTFFGKTIAGDWTLKAVDDEVGFSGILYEWNIRIKDAAPALNILSDNDFDTKIEVEKTLDEDVLHFVADGSERLTINSDSSVFKGDLRVLGGSFSSGFENNTNTGYYAAICGGVNNTVSNDEAFIGSGQNNIASGYRSFIGAGTNNEASGWSASTLGTGLLARSYSETVIGTYNTDYTPNSAGGIDADDRLFIIGNGTSSSAANRSNAVTVLKNGNFGIGVYAPSELLEVNGNILTDNAGDFYSDATNGVFNIGGGIMNDKVNIIADNTPTLNNVDGDEDLYIEEHLELGVQGYKPGGGTWATASDARLKKDIQPYKDGLAHLLQIKPVRFRYNDIPGFPEPEREYVGIVAQEMQAIAPYMVKEEPFGQKVEEDENGNETVVDPGTPYLTYDGTALTYMLVNAVQEQQAILETKTEEINMLHTALKRQQKEMEHITKGLRTELSALKVALKKVTSSTTD